MGVDIRWFNHHLREYIDTGARWGFTGHPSACILYALMRGPWNGDQVAAHSDHDSGEEFSDLAREYVNVTTAAEAELARVGCWCVKGKTPDDPPSSPDTHSPTEKKSGADTRT